MRWPASSCMKLRVARCVAAIASELQSKRTDVPLWIEIKRAYELVVARRPDSDFYRTFFNSVTRDLFGTVGVNPEVEFCATSVGRASGAVPIRVYRVGGSLPTAVREILTDLPFGAAIGETDAAVHRISAEIGRYFQTGRATGHPESIELIEPVFYRGMHAFVVGRLIGDGSLTPLVLAFTNSPEGVQVESVMMSRADVGSLFGYARSYFHVDLPVVSARSLCCAPSCRASPSTSCTRCSAAQNRARRTLFRTAKALGQIHRQFRACAGRSWPGDDRIHPALPRPGVSK